VSSASGTRKSRPGVQSVHRALELLEAVDAAGGTSSISALAADTSLSVGTVHRLAQTLIEAGYLRQLPDRRYCLGSRLVALGARANSLVATRARPVLVSLARELGETANLAVLSGGRAEYLAQAAGRHSMRTFTEVGYRVPLHSTGVGKALLSMLTDDDAFRVLDQSGMPAKTATTITDTDQMLAELATIRARGYVVDDEEMELGVRCVAVPVRATSMMAVSVSGPAARMTNDFLAEAVPVVLRSGARLAAILGDDR
jgi:IclR family acetate operon transcriptional repressor